MATWLISFGVFGVVLGMFLLSPLSDLMPVDFLQSIKALIHPSSSPPYFRVVAAEKNNYISIALVAIGVALVIGGMYLRSQK